MAAFCSTVRREGIEPLLELIAGIMRARGVETTLENLLITTGSQQGLDLVARVLFDPDDVILVELPTYTGAITAFRNVQATMVGVPQEADGIDLDALDEIHQRLVGEGRRVRALYLVPNFQNPTGLLIGLDKRRRLLEWAERRNTLIVEDDPYRELYFEDSASEHEVRPIRADDANGRVIYLSSFSKTLAPGYRVAWIDAPALVSAKFELAKQAEDLCTGGLDQRIIYEAARRGVLDKQIPILRKLYQGKRDVMVEALRQEFRDDEVQLAGSSRRVFPLGNPAESPRRRQHGRARRGARRHLCRGVGVLRGWRWTESHSTRVLSAVARQDPRRRLEAGGGRP